MMITKNTLLLGAIGASLFFTSCGENAKKTEDPVVDETETEVEVIEEVAPVYNAKDPSSMLKAVAYATGGWDDLYDKKDVEYTYSYKQGDGKEDISTERYIFDTEASYGLYSKNEVNAMPGKEGKVEQYYDGEKAVALFDNEIVEDPKVTGGATFLRQANYFWFVMPYKLSDKGNVFKLLDQEEYNGTTYDKVHVSYDPAVTGKEVNDTYVLYINPETKLIDRFLFSLPAMGVNDPVIAADYSYKDIDGQMVSTKRNYFMPSATGEYGETPNIVHTITDLKFNNGFDTENIMK